MTLHKYLYGNANPVNYTDPSGLSSLADQLNTLRIGEVLAGIGLVGMVVTQPYEPPQESFDLDYTPPRFLNPGGGRREQPEPIEGFDPTPVDRPVHTGYAGLLDDVKDLISYLFSINVNVEVELSYKSGWSPEQIAEANRKVADLDTIAQTGKLVGKVNASGRLDKKPRIGRNKQRYEEVYGEGSVPDGYQVDHIHDLDFGGEDTVTNMTPREPSVNQSLGPQLAARAKSEAKKQLGTKPKNVDINVTRVTIK